MAEKDLASGLIEKINNDFDKNILQDKRVDVLNEKRGSGKATYKDAYDYAESVGNARAKALSGNINSAAIPEGKMYYGTAKKVMTDSLTTDHNMITDYAADVQEAYNKKAGISLKAQKADVDEDRIDGFAQRMAAEENIDDLAWILKEPVVTHARSVVDDNIKKNAEFQHKAGISATVKRDSAAKCCDWCADLGGEYTYPNVPREVFQRHDHCKCTVDYEGKKLKAYSSGGKAHTFRDPDEIRRPSRSSGSGRSAKDRKDWHGYKTKEEYVNRFVRQQRINNMEKAGFYFSKDGGIITSKDRKPIQMDLQFFANKSKQYGKKIGKHAKDYGLDPSKAEDREKMVSIIDNIHRNSDEVRIGHWRGQEEDVLFHIKGNDVVITKQNEEFITVLKDGADNSGVKNARRR